LGLFWLQWNGQGPAPLHIIGPGVPGIPNQVHKYRMQ
jgi:hypothetical protein